VSTVIRTGASKRARIFFIAALTALTTSLALIPPHAAQAATPPTYAQMMQRVIDDTNAVRAAAGLPPLVRNAVLDQVAAAWSAQMWLTGVMGHNPSYSVQITAGWLRAGENVAKGYTYLQVVPAWKASPSHNANLVGDYTSVGVGYFEQDGRRYWTQLFAKYAGVVQPPAPAPTPTPTPTPVPIVVIPALEPLPPLGVPIALSSPSFESGLGTWVAPAGIVEGPNTKARGGVRSLVVPGAAGRTIMQTVVTNVPAGSTHTFTVYIRADATATGVVRLRTLGGTTPAVAVLNYTASSTGWLRVAITMKVQAAYTGFRLEVVTPVAGRSYRLDSVSLVRTGTTLTVAPLTVNLSTAP
jgi:uncharacterized protein YkwD